MNNIQDLKSLSTVQNQLPRIEKGHVWLVGAGPGDPGLLTLHALNALVDADVIIYDALVSDQCLELARPDVSLEFAGKRGGKPSAKQRDISFKLIELARSGKKVLRLKGGDPLIFGRGGEEALCLVENNIPFRIVPGITAGIGGLAYAGIPVTHRETNHSVTFLTGHDSNGIIPEAIDWELLARSSPVIVMYMALKHIQHIVESLLNAGRKPDESMAFVCNATMDDQIVVETTLGNALKDISKVQLKPPAIVVIGPVVSLRDALDWQGALNGKKLCSDLFSKKIKTDAS